MLSVFIIFFASFMNINSAAPKVRYQSGICSDMGPPDLEHILGGAFNPRYMSIDEPKDNIQTNDLKRDSDAIEFVVDSNFVKELDPEPAWTIDNHVAIAKKMKRSASQDETRNETSTRAKRVVNYSQQWECASKIEWIDLGPDYFPRYLRSMVCLSKKCWFDMFKCKPRSFTVKVLRRKKGFCASASRDRAKAGNAGLPQELRQLWVWEERAVNFCCDCVLS